MLRTSSTGPDTKIVQNGTIPNDTKLPHHNSMSSISSLRNDNPDFTSVPDWVCSLLGASQDDVDHVLIDSISNSSGYSGPGHSSKSRHLYPVLIEYCAYYAVNTDESVSKVDHVSVADPNSNDRRVEGRLSSRLYAFNSLVLPVDETSDSSGSDTEGKEKKCKVPKAFFYFGIGTARLQINGKDVCISHQNVGPPLPVECRTQRHRELRLFARDSQTIQELSDAALKWDLARNKGQRAGSGKYQLYTLVKQPFRDVFWKNEGFKASRSLESIILPNGMLKEIVDDFKHFSASDNEEWYISHGLPYRRSFLFYGPPGVGKTSTIRALAGELKRSACFLTLGNCDIGNSELQTALRNIPDDPILVIEDIDALFNEDRKTKNPSPLTFSGLLNSLDGLVSKDGILTVMTTNHIEKLDPALVRAGRVDRRFHFKLPTHEQIMGLFASFYPDADKKLRKEFADAVFDRKEKDARSIATLQEHFIFTRRKNARQSVDAVNEFFTKFYPDGSNANGMSLYA